MNEEEINEAHGLAAKSDPETARVIEKLIAAYEQEDRWGAQLIEERDANLATIDLIADTLGDEGEWSNLHDRGMAAVQLAAECLSENANHRAAIAEVNGIVAGFLNESDGNELPENVRVAMLKIVHVLASGASVREVSNPDETFSTALQLQQSRHAELVGRIDALEARIDRHIVDADLRIRNVEMEVLR